jgi:hypothetical protein
MVSRDVAALFMEHMPDDKIRSLRDSIAKAEAELTAPMWERHRDLHGRIEELKDKCEEAAHYLDHRACGQCRHAAAFDEKRPE